MNPTQLLAHFDRLAEAPNAVPRLRRFILDLAVRGKLVEQDARNEPATELLKLIQTERLRALNKSVKSGAAPKTESESPDIQLPVGWTWSKLGDLCTKTGSGSTPAGGKDAYVPAGVPFLRSQNVYDDGLRLDGVVYISDATQTRMSSTTVKAGDLLLNITGGSIGRCAVVPDSFVIGNINQHVAIIRLALLESKRFLHSVICSDYFQKHIFDNQTGAGREGLPKNRMDEILIPIAPLAEQHRIVAKVDELMALCDQFEAAQQERERRRDRLAAASLQRLNRPADDTTPEAQREYARFHLHHLPRFTTQPEHIKAMRQTILNLAVRGAFSENNEWSLYSQPLKSAATIQNGYAFKSEWFAKTGIRLLRNTNVSHGVIRWNELACLPIEQADEFERFKLKEGDVVLSLDRPFIGTGTKVARVRTIDLPCLLLQRVGRFQLNTNLLISDYLFQWIESSQFSDQVDPGRSNGVPHISSKQVENAKIFLPPIAEQRRIVAQVNELTALVDNLEMQLELSRAVATDLLNIFISKSIGVKQLPQGNDSSQHKKIMKSKDSGSTENRLFYKPLNSTIQSFVLRRFVMSSGYRSLGKFDCTYHCENIRLDEASPICLVGLNGSGKSNLIEAIAEVFCFLELINLPWKKVSSISSRYRANRHQFELEYSLKDAHGERLIRVRKSRKTGAEFYIVLSNGSEKSVEPGRAQLLLLPRRIVGYSSGLNETVSHPFLRTKTIYSEEVRDAAPSNEAESSEGDSVFDTRTLYMDYESNAAILISNYIFCKPSELTTIEEFTRVRGVSNFGLRFNRKRAGKSGPNSVVRLTKELKSYLHSFALCAGTTYDEDQVAINLNFRITPETITLFRREFKSAEALFMAMHKWSLLNALILSDEQRNVYLSSDITIGALERPPSVPPSDRVFNVVDLKVNLSTPSIEIDYSGLSDGEHQFIQVFGTALLFSEPGTLFLFDEPESNFNPEWRTKFNLILNRLPNCGRQEYVISTHSPFVVSGSRQENVYKFTRSGGSVTCERVDFETYGAAFDVLLKRLYSVNSLIDQSAREDLEQIIKRGNVEEMKKAVEEFAESKEKRRLYEAIIQKDSGK